MPGASRFGLCPFLQPHGSADPHLPAHALAKLVYLHHPSFSQKFGLWYMLFPLVGTCSCPTPFTWVPHLSHVNVGATHSPHPPGWGPQPSAARRSCLPVVALATLNGYCFPSFLFSPPGCKRRQVGDRVCCALLDISTT